MAELEAALRASQRRLPEAFSLLEESLIVYRELGQSHFAGRFLAQQGFYLIYDDEPEKAVAILEEALTLLLVVRSQWREGLELSMLG